MIRGTLLWAALAVFCLAAWLGVYCIARLVWRHA